MMPSHKLNEALDTAEIRRTSGRINSDQFVQARLRNDLEERNTLLSAIENDVEEAEMRAELRTEISQIQSALSAYSPSPNVVRSIL